MIRIFKTKAAQDIRPPPHRTFSIVLSLKHTHSLSLSLSLSSFSGSAWGYIGWFGWFAATQNRHPIDQRRYECEIWSSWLGFVIIKRLF